MTRRLISSALAIAALGFMVPTFMRADKDGGRAPQPVLGVEELCRLDLLPKLRSSVRIGCISSYDRTGGNDDGFSGKYSYIRKEAGGLVLADLVGPGIIYRIHTPTPTEDTVEFYFDGEERPRISARFSQLFDGSRAPFLEPLVGFGAGGYFCYVPIAFQSSCKILLKAQAFKFLQINYALYPKKTAVPSYQEPPSAAFLANLEEAGRIINETGSDISSRFVPAGTPVETRSTRGLLGPMGRLNIFEASGPGRIIGLRLRPAAAFAGKDKDILIKMYWDEDPEPAVACPVGDFFGYSFGEPSMRSLFAGTSNGENYMYLPMPYERSARIEIVSERPSGPDLEIESDVRFALQGKARDEGRLYALWRRENPCTVGLPYTYLKTTGRGHVVGVILQAQGAEPGHTSFFEGDDRTFIDGQLAIPGTGSEDSFNGGYYDIPGCWYGRLSLPLSGCLDYLKPLGRTGGYRWLITDAYAYSQSIEFTVEHGPVGNQQATDYSSVTYFYSLDPPGQRESLLPLPSRRVSDPDKIVYTPGWNVPIYTFSLTHGTIEKKTIQIGEKNYRYLSLRDVDAYEFRSLHPHHLSFIFEIPAAGRYDVKITALTGPEQGIVRLYRNGRPAGDPVNLFAAEPVVSPPLFLGAVDMAQGDNILFLTMVGKDARARKMGLDLIEVTFERTK